MDTHHNVIVASVPSLPSLRSDLQPSETLTFEGVYDEHADFVYRGLRRLGVSDAQLEDAFQDVFIVVLRKLQSFEGRSALTTWLYGIMLQVVRNHRRTLRRRREDVSATGEMDGGLGTPAKGESPESNAETHEEVRLLYQLLGALDDDKREVFVLAELEEMSAPDIASMLGQNLNTVYARIRAARQAFEQALSRQRAAQAFRGTDGRTR